MNGNIINLQIFGLRLYKLIRKFLYVIFRKSDSFQRFSLSELNQINYIFTEIIRKSLVFR